MVSFIPNNFIPSTEAAASEISDEALTKSRGVIAENSQRSQKWSLIAQIGMWSMFFIISGATTGLIQHASGALSYALIGGAIALTGALGVIGGLISNKIGTTNSFNQSEYTARTIAKEIEKLGVEKEKAAGVTITAATVDAPILSVETSGKASPQIHTKGLEYLHALMDAPVASQKIN